MWKRLIGYGVLLAKLDARRRTEAIRRARELGIVP